MRLSLIYVIDVVMLALGYTSLLSIMMLCYPVKVARTSVVTHCISLHVLNMFPWLKIYCRITAKIRTIKIMAIKTTFYWYDRKCRDLHSIVY